MAVEVWALSDLHLGPGEGKGHFSSSWNGHQPRIRRAWDSSVPEDALVLMPGDFSWYQKPEDLRYDYYWINDRPGWKVLSPGNHDYGVWSNHETAEEFVSQFDRMKAVYGEAFRIQNPEGEGPGIVVTSGCGTAAPEDYYFNSNGGVSSKSQEREIVRFFRELKLLKKALKSANEIRLPGDSLVVLFHYPPFANEDQHSVWSESFTQAGVDLCVYGHLHQPSQWRRALQGLHEGVEYRFVGADYLDWKPLKLGEWDHKGLFLNDFEQTPAPVSTREEDKGTWDDEEEWERAWSSFGLTQAGAGHQPTSSPLSSELGRYSNATGCSETNSQPSRSASCPAPPGREAFFWDVTGEEYFMASCWSETDSGTYLVDDLLIGSDGCPRACSDCGKIILEFEEYVESEQVFSHSSQDGTCPFMGFDDDSDEEDLAPKTEDEHGGQSPEGLKELVKAPAGCESSGKESSEKKMKSRFCVACEQEIKDGVSWHGTSAGAVHGIGAFDSPAHCSKLNSPTNSVSRPPLNVKGCEARSTCVSCRRKIFKAEPWHNTAKGKIHGWGFYSDLDTCQKMPIVNHVPGNQVRQNSYQSDPAWRASNFSLEEARLLDGWAREYMQNVISSQGLWEKARELIEKPAYKSTTGGTTTVTSYGTVTHYGSTQYKP
jgi:predicted phosphohydrolase